MFPATFNFSQLNGQNGFVISGLDRLNQLGVSVSEAGDVNGDGIDDIVLLSKFPGQGQAYVVFGKSEGLRSLNLSRLDGRNGFTISGNIQTVNHAGDVNNDGFDDLLLAARTRVFIDLSHDVIRVEGNSRFVIFGNKNGFNGQVSLVNLDGYNGFTLNNTNEPLFFLEAESSAGDINLDGIDDIVISGRYRNSETTESYVIFGQKEDFNAIYNLAELDGSNGFKLIGAVDSERAPTVSNVGDLNADGVDDLVLGLTSDGISGYVLFGSSAPFDAQFDLSNLNGKNGFYLQGDGYTDISSISSLGDVNGDRIDDIVIGVPGKAVGKAIAAGKSYVLFGNQDGFDNILDLSQLNGQNGFILEGTFSQEQSGLTVSGLGDVNRDGVNDILIGTRGGKSSQENTDVGKSYVVFGRSDTFEPKINLASLDGLTGFTLRGGHPNKDYSDLTVSGAGDINNDGVDDIIVGVPLLGSGPRLYAGKSYIIFGKSNQNIIDEKIIGLQEADQLKGFDGNDTLLGRSGDDILVGGSQKDILRGGNGNDTLYGGSGKDQLFGGAGDDRLKGGKGFDQLKGGAGRDKFIFEDIHSQADRIVDFDTVEDKIILSKLGFDIDVPLGQIADARLVTGRSARNRSDRFIYNDQTGALLFDADGSRSGEAIAIAVLNQGLHFTASNIKII